MEPNSPKKIQFAVPLFQSQLDPEASEQIRKRRPTPASLVILNEHTPPVDDKRTNSTNEENVSPRQRKQSVFTAPAMKGAVQAKPFICNDNHQSSSMLEHITAENSDPLMKPRRKDTPYPLEIPFIPAVKQIKKQNDSSFPEEEEDGEDEEEVCDH
ncbi:protein phosphatase 1 regulatory subunit 1C isoform X2 [Xenopus tropicalis]|uniref:Protein phosphatase 1 regulatory subunit 1C isoform X2 n=1 Tax=Xenopus tropicalis TaxID=8364 RepID=A0A8J1IV97_XENTR|nr:protein phosphatase 1 regulatory subunit 1C isoform X2 [Xenopus tropicalis]